MGLLWLFSVAIVCHIAHATALSTGTKGQQQKLSNNITRNGSDLAAIKVITSFRIPNGTQEYVNATENKTSVEKTINLKAQKLLEKREIPKFIFSKLTGKRDEESNEDKRAKFSSWGGKRSDFENKNEFLENAKRAKFSSWGGKRDFASDYMPKADQVSSWDVLKDGDNINENKRAKFNSWAGKRADESLDDKRAKFSSWAGKRGRFNSWAGKRSGMDVDIEGGHIPVITLDHHPIILDQPGFYGNEEKRAKFSSWAGKRAPDYLGTSWSIPSDNRIKYYPGGMGESGNENIVKLWQDLMSRKRARFSSWAGKRSEQEAPDMESLTNHHDSESQEKRAKFSSWAGKREDPEKRKFSSWGGKRGMNMTYSDMLEEKEGYPSMIVKRSVFSWNGPSLAYKRKPVFSSWGGKRSDTHTIQVRSLPIQRVLMNGGKNWGTLMRPIRRGPDFYAWGGKRST